MKKFWSYLAVGFAFFSAGLITMYKVMGERISITVKKQRIRGDGNKMILDIDPVVEEAKKRPRRTREERKADKVQKRNNKKLVKEQGRLEKRL